MRARISGAAGDRGSQMLLRFCVLALPKQRIPESTMCDSVVRLLFEDLLKFSDRLCRIIRFVQVKVSENGFGIGLRDRTGSVAVGQRQLRKRYVERRSPPAIVLFERFIELRGGHAKGALDGLSDRDVLAFCQIQILGDLLHTLVAFEKV